MNNGESGSNGDIKETIIAIVSIIEAMAAAYASFRLDLRNAESWWILLAVYVAFEFLKLWILKTKVNAKVLLGGIAILLLGVAIGSVLQKWSYGFCSHTYTPATCISAETCTKCGETRGSSLGHSWQAATCVFPETCTKCGETRGSSLGHNWQPATCEKAKTCARCGATEGAVAEHTWTQISGGKKVRCLWLGRKKLLPQTGWHGVCCQVWKNLLSQL